MLLRVWENKHYHKLLRSINCCTYFWEQFGNASKVLENMYIFDPARGSC